MVTVFNAASFGAIANDGIDDTAAINAAVAAAHAEYLKNPSAGRVTVVLPAGTLLVKGSGDKSDGAISMLSGTALQGAGMGQTILKVADGWAGDITGVVRTPFDQVTSNVGVFDLTIDGNRDATTGKIDGFYTGVRPGSPQQDSDIHVSRVEVMDCSGYGFDPHEQTLRLTIENSVSHGNGLDGFVADYIVNGVYRNNIAYGNDRHGFNITTTTTGLLLQNNIAYSNGSTGAGGAAGIRGHPVAEQHPGRRRPVLRQHQGRRPAQHGGPRHHQRRHDLRQLEQRRTHRGIDQHRHSEQQHLQQRAGCRQPVRRDQHPRARRCDHGTDLLFHQYADPQQHRSIPTGAIDARYGIREEADEHGRQAPLTSPSSATSSPGWTREPSSPRSRNGSERPDPTSFRGTGFDEDLSGRSGNDTIRALGGNDYVFGDGGHDRLYGDDGKDWLFGGNGNDRLYGGLKNDTLSGDTGRDVFVFDTRLGSSTTDRKVNFDTVAQYSARDDSIWLDNAIFRKLGPGSASRPHKLDADFFNAGNRPKDSDDYINYNKKTGILSYDPDGSGSARPVEFAKFKAGLALTHNEFFVI